ncbi:MAG: hypothetical protein MPJ50_04985 [Pirellulales bacterium]|nr:hypothetical protein [Pirellulales bacterium]
MFHRVSGSCIAAGLFLVILVICATSAVKAQNAKPDDGSALRLIAPDGAASHAPLSQVIEGGSERVASTSRQASARALPIRAPDADEGNGDVEKSAEKALPPLELRSRIATVLDRYENRPLNSGENSPWQVMHRIVAYGVETQIEVGRPGGVHQSAIGWLLFNQPFRGQRLLVARNNSVYGKEGRGLQGHGGQLLAILAQSKLQRDYPIRVGEQEFSVEDLIRSEQRTCRARTELTFKLIGLAHYLPSDTTWKSDDGQAWSIERLVREEISQRIQGGTCGGTHRLMGLTYAVVRRKQQGLELTGDFARAATYINEYIDYALKLRNPDGSFSTSFLEHRAMNPDLSVRLRTTGHILEWLAFAVSDDTLRDPEIVESVEYLTQILEQSPNRNWEVGPLGHALHALALYQQRVWGKPQPRRETASHEDADTSLDRTR